MAQSLLESCKIVMHGTIINPLMFGFRHEHTCVIHMNWLVSIYNLQKMIFHGESIAIAHQMIINIDQYVFFVSQCKWVRSRLLTGSLYGGSLQGLDWPMWLSGNGLYLGYGAGLEGPQLEWY